MADPSDYAHIPPDQPQAFLQGPGIMYLRDPAAAQQQAQSQVDAAQSAAQSLQTRRTLFGKPHTGWPFGVSDEDVSAAQQRIGDANRELNDVQTYRRRSGR